MTPGADDKHQSMQRVRVGAIGLGVVVLLIGVASMLFSGLRDDRFAGANATAAANMVAVNELAEANEPLADLGVAPSADDASPSPSPSRAQTR
jgi:hypothetical protein